MTSRRRLHALIAIAAALAWNVAPLAARPVAAIDCSQVFCGTIEIVPTTGSGVGHVTSDPPGIDCTWNGSRSGTCVYQFSWPHFVGGTTQVDLYLDPGPTSYACYALVCGEIDQTLVRTITLNAG